MLIPKDRTSQGMKDGPFVAKTDDQGQFSIGPLGKPGEGAPPGAYALSISTGYTEDTSETAKAPPETVPPPHSTTGVDFEVPAGGTSEANFDLKSK